MKQTPVADSDKQQSSGVSLAGRFRQFVKSGARDWGITATRLKLMLTIPFLIALSGAVAALLGKEAYKLFTREDGIAETLQVLCWIGSLVLALNIIRNYGKSGNRAITTLYIVLAVGIFFMIGEEISWGQRMFGWETPESYAQINKQEETNLHNIYGIGYTFKWLHLLVAAYGVFMPLLLLRSRKLQPYREELSMLVPHYTLVPFFFLPFAWRLYRNLFPAPEDFYFVVSEYSEVMELVLVSGILLFLLFQKRWLAKKEQPNSNGLL